VALPATPTLLLHVGIHKTASTFIQHRLKANRPLLEANGLLVPRRRKDHLALVAALRQRRFEPWAALLEQAAAQGCQPLISAEVLSLELARVAEPDQPASRSRLSWLQRQLERQGIGLVVAGYVRDQPAYLNSRYTQLIKRFYLSSHFEGYVKAVLAGRRQESLCDYQRLFGEALEHPGITTHLLPFPGVGDPCERLLAALGFARGADLAPLARPLVNSQPGWRAVWLARWLAHRLRRDHPAHWQQAATRRRLRRQLEQLAQREQWPAEPFQALTPDLAHQIQLHYAASNAWLAQRAWGGSWAEQLPPQEPPPLRCRPATLQERRELVGLGRGLLKAELSHGDGPAASS
jgi:hypothetical protein